MLISLPAVSVFKALELTAKSGIYCSPPPVPVGTTLINLTPSIYWERSWGKNQLVVKALFSSFEKLQPSHGLGLSLVVKGLNVLFRNI